jgi:DNA polymerase-3 subunit chi
MAESRSAEFVELHAAGERVRLICTAAQRAFEGGGTAAVYVPDPAEARELDEALWTFAQDAFIPHVRLEEAQQPLIEPVVLFSGEPGDVDSDLLIVSTGGELPEWFARFRRIRDFAVLYDEPLRQASRARFAACRAAGYHMSLVKTPTQSF